MDIKQILLGFKPGEEPVAHFGVLGMKWGVRRTDAELSRARASKASSSDFKRAKQLSAKVGRKGDTRALSNDELRELTTRLNLESQFNKLTSSKSGVDVAHGHLKTALGLGSSFNNVIGFANSDAGKLLAASIGVRGNGTHTVGKHKK